MFISQRQCEWWIQDTTQTIPSDRQFEFELNRTSYPTKLSSVTTLALAERTTFPRRTLHCGGTPAVKAASGTSILCGEPGARLILCWAWY